MLLNNRYHFLHALKSYYRLFRIKNQKTVLNLGEKVREDVILIFLRGNFMKICNTIELEIMKYINLEIYKVTGPWNL